MCNEVYVYVISQNKQTNEVDVNGDDLPFDFVSDASYWTTRRPRGQGLANASFVERFSLCSTAPRRENKGCISSACLATPMILQARFSDASCMLPSSSHDDFSEDFVKVLTTVPMLLYEHSLSLAMSPSETPMILRARFSAISCVPMWESHDNVCADSVKALTTVPMLSYEHSLSLAMSPAEQYLGTAGGRCLFPSAGGEIINKEELFSGGVAT